MEPLAVTAGTLAGASQHRSTEVISASREAWEHVYLHPSDGRTQFQGRRGGRLCPEHMCEVLTVGLPVRDTPALHSTAPVGTTDPAGSGVNGARGA